MKFRKRYIRSILQCFNINGKPIEIHPFLERVSKREARYVLRVCMKDGQSYVVKLTCAKRFPHDLIERQSRFSEHLRRGGIQTPRRYAADGVYCIKSKKRGFDFSVTVEDYAGEELKILDMDTARELGELLARCHEISQRQNCLIGAPTIFDMAGHHDMNSCDEFRALADAPGIDISLHGAVLEAYDTRLAQALAKLAGCPKHAVQGDFSINNLSRQGPARQGSELWLFDYNNAGDDYLVADMITQGIFLSRDMDYAQPHNSDAMFEAFTRGYLEQRQLSEAEKCAASDCYAVSAAMWASGIGQWHGSLSELLKRGGIDAANRLLAEMLAMIRRGDFSCLSHTQLANTKK